MTRVDQGRSVSTAVSVGVKVAYFCQVQVFSVTELKLQRSIAATSSSKRRNW